MKDELEKMLDGKGIQGILDVLIELCNDKAEHIRTNWQDERLAKRWEDDAKILVECNQYFN